MRIIMHFSEDIVMEKLVPAAVSNSASDKHAYFGILDSWAFEMALFRMSWLFLQCSWKRFALIDFSSAVAFAVQLYQRI